MKEVFGGWSSFLAKKEGIQKWNHAACLHPHQNGIGARPNSWILRLWRICLLPFPRHRNEVQPALQAGRQTQITGSDNRTSSSFPQNQTQSLTATGHISRQNENLDPRFLPNRRAGPRPSLARKVSSPRRRRSSDHRGILFPLRRFRFCRFSLH